jgi:D-glycero-alpha-D-manno-heptose 1-phosphate guanylyltransferase
MGRLHEAVILSGGLGTRLKEVVSDLPKTMAPIKGKPFLHYVVDYLRNEGIEHFVFALGYKNEMIIDYLESKWADINKTYSVEPSPLGTGGAILGAVQHTSSKHICVVNGDTFFRADLKALAFVHVKQRADCTLCLKPMMHFERYGVVELDGDQRVSAFHEKQRYDHGLINAGTYALNTKSFSAEPFPQRFSFEKDYLEKNVAQRNFRGIVQDRYFIDIGIPEDYQRAENEINNPDVQS